MKRVTIKDLAKLSGFSTNTVSRALNNRPEIRRETKEKILKIASELGYRPNRLAKGLRQKKSGIVGVIVTDIANPFFGAVVKSVEKTARDLGYGIVLQDTNEDFEQEQEAVQIMLAQQVDGLLITPVQTSRDTIRDLENDNLPFVLLARRFADWETDYVIPNDTQGGFIATEHLIECGHTRIAIANGPPYVSSTKERFAGYEKALKKHGIEVNEAWVRTGAVTVEGGYRAACALLKTKPRPSAIVAYSDFVAFGVLRAVREVHLKVPDDIAVVGFDDIELSSCLPFPLTTVWSPKQDLGKEAMLALHRRISDSDMEEKQQRELEMRLIIRQTTDNRLS